MSRAEELTLKIIEGTANQHDLDELEWVIASDPEEQLKHITVMQIEALLRGQRQDLDLAASTLSALDEALEDRKKYPRFTGDVDPIAAMAQSNQRAGIDEPGSKQAALRRKRRKRKKAPLGLYIAFFVTVLLVAAGFIIRQQTNQSQRQPINVATISGFSGSVTVMRDGSAKIAKVGSPLVPGNEIRTGTNTTVAANYDTHTRFELASNSIVTINPPIAPSQLDRAISVHGGEVTVAIVDATRSPALVVHTPHAQITTLSAQYTVTVTANRTRVSVAAGSVKVSSVASSESVEVPTRYGAVVQAGLPLVARSLDAKDRVAKDLLAIYRFTEGSGKTIADTSRVGSPMNLQIENEGAVRWAEGSLSIVQPTKIRTDGPATKLITLLRDSGAFTIELWLKPADLTQVAPIFTMPSPDDPGWVNLYLGQGTIDGQDKDGTRLVSRLRTTNTGPEGLPEFRSEARALAGPMVQIVWVRTAEGQASFYVDGKPVSSSRQAGALDTWAPNFPLILANSVAGDQPWLGELRLLAIYSRGLSDQEVNLNYEVGLTGSTLDIPEDQPASSKKVEWTNEAYFLRFTGETRSDEFVIRPAPVRIRYRIKLAGQSSTGELHVRLQSVDNPDVVEDVLKTAASADGVYAPKAGAGQYCLLITGPADFQGEIWVEQTP